MKIKYIIIILLFPVNIFGQLNGVVLSEKNEPLPYVNLIWLGTDIGTTTDNFGNFEIAVSEQTDFLIVSCLSYKTDTVKVENRHKFLKIVLQEEKNVLNEVAVLQKSGTINMRTTTLNMQKITTEELKRAACCNLSESFETNASVDVSYSDAATGAKQIRLLGLSGTYVQLMTENIPNLKGIASPYGLSYIPGTWMESIQISKGAGSVINGYEAVTGQINVEYKKPQTADKLSINLYTNETARMEANIDAAFRIDGTLSTGILLHYSDEFYKQDSNKDNFLDMPMVRQFNGVNRWYYQKDGFMSQLFLHSLYEKRMGGQINVANPYQIEIETQRYEFFLKNGYVFDAEKEQSIGWILSGNWQKLHSNFGNQKLEISKYQDWGWANVYAGLGNVNDTIFFKRYKGEQLSLYSNLIFSTKFTKEHKITAGWSVSFDRIKDIMPLKTDDLLHSFFRPKNEFVTGFFAEYTYDLCDKIIVVAGIRNDYNTHFKKIIVTPRLHVKYMPMEQIHLRATLGKGYRTANILAENNNFLAGNRKFSIDFIGNSLLESSWNGGVTANFYIPIKNRELTITADYFYTQFQSQAVVDFDKNAHEVNIYALKGKSYSHNFQIEATMEAFRGFNFTAAWRWTDVKQTTGGELREKPFTPRWRALLTASYATKLNKWQFDYTLQANGGGRLAVPDAVNPMWDKEFKPFLINNAQITKNFKKWGIYLGCENIFNFVQKNPIIDVQNPFGSNFDATMIWGPTHGRKVYAGFRWAL
ncbi:MAG: TonB-dependent receptor [Prevotellaceae bacterium]|jgi:outer membrane receptor for ferrienterochelin and colicin|nr:TonB-dependent receptor [Prevotellaceae bacterium]